MSENETGCSRRISLHYVLHLVTIVSLLVLVLLLVWERNSLRERIDQERESFHHHLEALNSKIDVIGDDVDRLRKWERNSN